MEPVAGTPAHTPDDAVARGPSEADGGQLEPFDMATPKGEDGALSREATNLWTEDKLLELATSMLDMRTIRHQPRSLRQRTSTIPRKLLQNHTHRHGQWCQRRDPDCLKARWAWLCPSLLV